MMSAPGTRFIASIAVLLPSASAFSVAHSQQPATVAVCGKAEVSIADARFLTLNDAVIAIELPSGWVLEENKSNPFFLLRAGDHYESARTLMYINIQHLDGSFEQAVESDTRDFRRRDSSAQIVDEAQLEILEKGCPAKTQRFIYKDKGKQYVDQVTKIGINGLLLNVVLSSNSTAEIVRNEKDYKFLLKHIGLVMRSQ